MLSVLFAILFCYFLTFYIKLKIALIEKFSEHENKICLINTLISFCSNESIINSNTNHKSKKYYQYDIE